MAHRTVSCGPGHHRPGLPDDPRARTLAPTASCPVEITLHALRGRWTTLVIRELLRGPHTFSELEAALPELSAKVLTDRLRQLVEVGVVHRERFVGWPTSVRYRLTERGHALGPVLQALWNWGANG
ncbi:helix-turn-helix domain-containing protein [Streptomyces sp. 891-h]|uniref:winged helix-turn-helix transcriptional regulator n=1 Tax=Streptomyces sp. 891-h TaxID=2720714 RepID=UPI001FA98F4B|nr:helix-turn-helix domain-containing protein [Streptomyces sp. 891-h]UNZ17601.1 helix-turn-helix transcriptional regulator [Streptomyces sp. 891-h]